MHGDGGQARLGPHPIFEEGRWRRGALYDRARLRPGDRILLSGSIGDHGTAIMLARGQFELAAEVQSDTCSLWPAVDALLDSVGPHLRCLRDATRGGVASVLNELARSSAVSMIVKEGDVPVRPVVAGATAGTAGAFTVTVTGESAACASPLLVRTAATKTAQPTTKAINTHRPRARSLQSEIS